jgi:hypothetical protein
LALKGSTDDYGTTVKEVLLATIGKDVAVQHTFQGKKGKRAFNRTLFFTTSKGKTTYPVKTL